MADSTLPEPAEPRAGDVEAGPRNRISLDGAWEFLHLVEDYRARPVEWRRIAVPGPWQAQFSDLRMRGGTGIYRRAFAIPAGWKRERLFLRFGAVFHIARVWVNEAYLGMHVGGFLPFSFDATDHLVEGDNEIKVQVDSPSDDVNEFSETPFSEIPFGKQSWYGPLSGIWQSVFIERRVSDHVVGARIATDWETGRATVRILLAEPAVSPSTIRLTVADPGGETAASVEAVIPRGSDNAELSLDVPERRPWSPSAPNLYTLTATLERVGMQVDRIEDRFGFRKIETRGGRLYLNGEPLYLRAALDQDYYPDTICTTPSTEFLEDQFRKAKELGLNCLRCHIKVPDPRYYEVADRMGLLIWTELPNMGLLTERSGARKLEMLKGIVDRDGNHPSIICWTIINENWGMDLVHDPDHRAWLKRAFVWLKAYDPGRLVVDNSPLSPSFHVQTDLADYHFYAAFPDNRRSWDRFVGKLAGPADWMFAPADAVSAGDEPRLCSEFGNWGLPDPEALKDAAGQEPWWFETGHDWAGGVMYPHGVENRFADWNLTRVFGSLRGFVEAAQWQQFRALKYEIETMRRTEAIAGYVITELTDAHWECNGLLDMRRNPRVFHDLFRTINADTVIVPRWQRVSYWAGETAAIELYVAHGAGGTVAGATLEIEFAGLRKVAVPDLEPGTVVSLGRVALPVPDPAEAHIRSARFELRAADGSTMATNSLDLALHPQRFHSANVGLVWSPREEWRERLASLGYQVAAEPCPEALWVTDHRAPGTDDAHVREGGRLLLLPEAELDLNPLFPHWQAVKVLKRADTLWQGDWASTFGWLHRTMAFSRIPGQPLLDQTFDRVLPTHVIAGCNLLDFQARVHAGLVVGWVHKPVALTVERRYGKGRFVVSTFRLFRDPPAADPTATVLLDALMTLALAQGSAAARDREAVISEMIERAQAPSSPAFP